VVGGGSSIYRTDFLEATSSICSAQSKRRFTKSGWEQRDPFVRPRGCAPRSLDGLALTRFLFFSFLLRLFLPWIPGATAPTWKGIWKSSQQFLARTPEPAHPNNWGLGYRVRWEAKPLQGPKAETRTHHHHHRHRRRMRGDVLFYVRRR
jgi:hypothetical protein